MKRLIQRRSAALILFALLANLGGTRVEAATTKTYWHPSHGYGFAYLKTWTAKKGTTSAAIKPPSARVAALKASGVAYSLSAISLNHDTVQFTATLQAALASGWSPFVRAYAKAVAKKYGGTASTKTYANTGWTANLVTLKKTKSGVTTRWRFILLTKDKASAYVITEKWTQADASPFASEVKALIKSLKLATDYIAWTYNGSAWTAGSTPPSCSNPLVIPSPVDVNQAASILYPGQTRGGNYKPHGGFRFDTNTTNAVAVTAPIDGYVVSGVRYIENGYTQYMFDTYSPCGIRVRFDHLLTLSSTFAALTDALPAAKVDDTRTTDFAKPIRVKVGDIIATGIGEGVNVFVDFGVYDLRSQNAISKDPTWAAAHSTYKGTEWYGICWLDNLPEPDKTVVNSLPGADGVSGKTSDYCD